MVLQIPVDLTTLPLTVDLTEEEVIRLRSVWTSYVDDLCAPGGGVLPDVVQSIRTISDTNSRAKSSSSGTAASDIGEVTEDSPQAVRRETSPESNSTGEGFSEEEGEQDWGCACAEEGRECGIGSGCDCVEDYGHLYTLDDEGRSVLMLPHPEHLPLVECGPMCACSSLGCANRVTHGRPAPGLILRASSLANLGLFVGQSLPKGTFITTYAGELISTSEACDRWARQKERGGQGEGNYVFCLREGEGRWNVDPTQIGGIGRFLNHSHAPNLIPLPIHHVPTHLTTPRIAFFALRDIRTGEELVWDYGDGTASTAGEDGVGEEKGRVECRCGGEKCDGFLPFDRDL